jgi:nucleoside-diphosphate-sugar epimerase
MTERVLVVGAQGALGHAVVELAAQRGQEVRALVRSPRAGFLPASVELLQGDVADAARVREALRGCCALLFCVNVPLASWTERMPSLLQSAVDACRQADVRLVFPGNVWIYGPGPKGQRIDEQWPPTPSSRKGRLRAALEAQLRGYARHTIVRLPEFYGPNVANRLMGSPFQRTLQGRAPVWYGGNLDVTVEYVFIRDAAHAMLAVALAKDVDGETYHVAGSGHTTPRTFFEQLRSAAGNPKHVRRIPNLAVRLGGLFDADAREFADILHLWREPVLLDATKYDARFSPPAPVPYAEAIAETLRWFRAHPDATNAN